MGARFRYLTLLILIICHTPSVIWAEGGHFSPELFKQRYPVSGPKPTVVIISYGRHGNPDREFSPLELFFPEDYPSTDGWPELDFLNPLTECGIKPILIDDVPLEKIPKVLKKRKVPQDAIVLINTHGSISNGKFVVGSDYSKIPTQSGDKLVESIYRGAKDAKVWVGTCHAGACTVEGKCIGKECRKTEYSWKDRYGWTEVSKLMCDGYNGSCDLWRKVDKNGDGIIAPEELAVHLKEKGNAPQKIEKNIAVILYLKSLDKLDAELEEKIENFEDECKDVGGKAKKEGSVDTKWTLALKFEKTGEYDTVQHLEEVEKVGFLKGISKELENADTKEKAEAVAKKYILDYPKDAKIVKKSIMQKMVCELSEPGFIFSKGKPEPEKVYHPDPGTFNLQSERCKR